MRKLYLKHLGIVMISVFSLFLLYHVIPVNASDPSLTEILNNLGFTNLTQINIETFPQGTYNITMYAEFAQYPNQNELSHYKINTSSFTVIFSGLEGGSGYVFPPITKTFTANCQFGLSLSRTLSYPYRYYTESSRNPDGAQYAKVYKNLDNPCIFLIGFDERAYCDETGDKDYNDMVFSLQLQHYLHVISPYDTPSGEGWYYNGTEAFASLANNVIDYGNETRAIFTHWSGDTSGTNYSKSEPIYMDQNKTVIANWKTQHLATFTQTNLDSSASNTVVTVNSVNKTFNDLPYAIWVDSNSAITYLYSNVASSTTGKRFTVTSITGPTSPITVVNPIIITGNYKTQYLLTVLTNPTGLAPQPTRNPTGEAGPPDGWWYDATTNIILTAESIPGYMFTHWDIDGVSQGIGVNLISVHMDKPYTSIANYTFAVPTLSVSIDPLSASIHVGDSLLFTSTVSGGTSPYIYQWYLNGNPVSGATSSNWTFKPTSGGTYYVHLNVTDAMDNTAQSETAKITVAIVPVGGQSYRIQVQTRADPLVPYVAFASVLTVISIKMRKRKH